MRYVPVRVPETRVDPAAGTVTGLDEAVRIVNENFRALGTFLDRAILAGTLVPGLDGDVTGQVADTTVEGLRGHVLSDPSGSDDGKVVAYASAGLGTFSYVSKLTDPMTTRGDMIYRGAAGTTRLAVGSTDKILASDGTDPVWRTLSAEIDAAIGSTRGAILYRGASGWAKLDPGTSGDFLKTAGAGADPLWASVAAGSSPLTTKGDLYGYSTLDARIPIGTDGHVLTADSAQALGLKWAAAPAAGTNALLDGSAHSDTLAGTVVRGDIIVGNSTPKWARVALGKPRHDLRVGTAGNDPEWVRSIRHSCHSPMYFQAHFGSAQTRNSNSILAGTNSGTVATSGDADRIANKFTTSTNNSRVGHGSDGTVTRRLRTSMNFYVAFDAKLADMTGPCVWSAGIATSIGPSSNAKRPASAHPAVFSFLSGTDTNFMCRTGDGTTASETDSGVAKDTNYHDFVIYSVDGGTTIVFEIDGAQVAAKTSNVPGTTQEHEVYNIMGTAPSGTSADLRSGYLYCQSGIRAL